MPSFRYRAYTRQGQLAEGLIEASSAGAASDSLWEKGLSAFEIGSVKPAASWWKRERAVGGGGDRLLTQLSRDLATLVGAGLPIDQTLRVIQEQSSSRQMRQTADTLLAKILSGAALSEAMRQQPQVFSAEFTSVITAAEMGGTVPKALGELADLLERRAEVRARLQGALIYPAILLVLALVSIVIMGGVFVPSVAPLFTEGGKPMPALLKLAVAAHDHWYELAIGFAVALLALSIALRMAKASPSLQTRVDRLILSLPLVGRMIAEKETARFARTLGTLLRSGVSMLVGLTAARNILANREMMRLLDTAIERVREGSSLHDALSDARPISDMTRRLVAVGEQSGQLDRMLLQTASVLEKNLQQNIDGLTTLLTPVFTIAIAGLIGGLILTVMGAVLDLNDLALR